MVVRGADSPSSNIAFKTAIIAPTSMPELMLACVAANKCRSQENFMPVSCATDDSTLVAAGGGSDAGGGVGPAVEMPPPLPAAAERGEAIE